MSVHELHLNTVIVLHSTLLCPLHHINSLYSGTGVCSLWAQRTFSAVMHPLTLHLPHIDVCIVYRWQMGNFVIKFSLWSNGFAVKMTGGLVKFSGVLSGKVPMILMILFSWISSDTCTTLCVRSVQMLRHVGFRILSIRIQYMSENETREFQNTRERDSGEGRMNDKS